MEALLNAFQHPWCCSRVLLLAVVLLVVVCRYVLSRPRGLPPGPRALPLVGNLPHMGKSPSSYLKKMSQHFGSVFSVYLGPRLAVILNDYSAVKDAFLTQGEIFAGRPEFYLLQITKGHKDGGNMHGIVDAEGPHWCEQRKFAYAKLRQFGMGKAKMEEKIHREFREFIDYVRQKKGKQFDPQFAVSAAMTNIILAVIFGKRQDYDDPEFLEIMAKISQGIKLISATGIVNHIPVTRYIPSLRKRIKQLVDCRNSAYKFINKHIQQHINTFDQNNCRGFCDAYINEIHQNSDCPYSGFTREEMKIVIHNFMVAGTETTTTRIRWGMIYLSRNPKVQRRFQKEVDEIVGATRPPSMKDKDNMPYAVATVQEIYRCGNGSALGLPHATTRAVKFRGYNIPARTMVIPHMANIMNDPKYFPNPQKFEPERFLDSKGALVNNEALIPFSVGPRQCVGKILGEMEMFLFFTALMQNFTLSFPENRPQPDLMSDAIMRSPLAHDICFMPRA